MSANPPVSWADAPAREYQKGKLSELLGEIVWRLPGITELEGRKALEKAADEFCRTTKCWRERVVLPPPDLWGAAPQFFFGPDAGLLPSGVLGCCTCSGTGEPIGMVFTGVPGPFSGGRGWAFRPGRPPAVFWPDGCPPPGVEPPEVYLTLRPGSDELPEAVLQRWGAAIADGAFGLLAMQDNRTWTDRPGAQAAMNRFHAACVAARADAEPKDRLGQPTVRNPIPFV